MKGTLQTFFKYLVAVLYLIYSLASLYDIDWTGISGQPKHLDVEEGRLYTPAANKQKTNQCPCTTTKQRCSKFLGHAGHFKWFYWKTCQSKHYEAEKFNFVNLNDICKIVSQNLQTDTFQYHWHNFNLQATTLHLHKYHVCFPFLCLMSHLIIF